MTQRKFRLIERKFLKLYSAWQETHQLQFAYGCEKLLGELLKINPGYSVRAHFQKAF